MGAADLGQGGCLGGRGNSYTGRTRLWAGKNFCSDEILKKGKPGREEKKDGEVGGGNDPGVGVDGLRHSGKGENLSPHPSDEGRRGCMRWRRP